MKDEMTIVVPGEALALLTPLQEMEPGLYLVNSLFDDWAELRWLIDDEANDKVIVTEQSYRIPKQMLGLFMPIGLRLFTTS